ncbi:MAG: hypothetical protein RL291_743 [Pseudomonadota bacterium]|jgi:uncharacterized protein (DUF952 family)
MTDLIYKIEDTDAWAKAQASGIYLGAPIDALDGFIHFSAPDQVRATAAKHFVGRPNLLLIAIDAAALGQALKWEPSRGGALFPHLYAPLKLRDVRSAVPLPLGANGQHVFPEDIP